MSSSFPICAKCESCITNSFVKCSECNTYLHKGCIKPYLAIVNIYGCCKQFFVSKLPSARSNKRKVSDLANDTSSYKLRRSKRNKMSQNVVNNGSSCSQSGSLNDSLGGETIDNSRSSNGLSLGLHNSQQPSQPFHNLSQQQLSSNQGLNLESLSTTFNQSELLSIASASSTDNHNQLPRTIFINNLKCLVCLTFSNNFQTSHIKSLSDLCPISILCAISKLLERIVHNQITAFMDKHNLFSSRQVGYRKFHNTQSALIELTDEVKLGMDRDELTLLILFDLIKAFDTVNHTLLLNKLRTGQLTLMIVSFHGFTLFCLHELMQCKRVQERLLICYIPVVGYLRAPF